MCLIHLELIFIHDMREGIYFLLERYIYFFFQFLKYFFLIVIFAH